MPDAHMAETSSPGDISVVIPTYNRGSQLQPLLEALLRQDARGVRYEIIVVDNNSRDNTASVIEAARVADHARLIRYFFEPRQGVSHARTNHRVRRRRRESRARLGVFDETGVRRIPAGRLHRRTRQSGVER